MLSINVIISVIFKICTLLSVFLLLIFLLFMLLSVGRMFIEYVKEDILERFDDE